MTKPRVRSKRFNIEYTYEENIISLILINTIFYDFFNPFSIKKHCAEVEIEKRFNQGRSSPGRNPEKQKRTTDAREDMNKELTRNLITKNLKTRREKNKKKGNARQLGENPDPPPTQPDAEYEDQTEIVDEETNPESYEESNKSDGVEKNEGESDESGSKRDLEVDNEVSSEEIDDEASAAVDER